jgi:hypothetical protein
MSEEFVIDDDPVKPLVGAITSYRDDVTDPQVWEVQQTVGEYGARVDFASGVLAVPLSGDSWSQKLKMRKVVEARISPMDDRVYSVIAEQYKRTGITSSVLRVAESARVNAVAKPFLEARGIDTDEVIGSEKKRGIQLATAGTQAHWDEAVAFTAEHHGTKGFDSFASGVRSVNPEWSSALRKLSKRLDKVLNRPPNVLGDTEPYHYTDEVVGPRGFGHTINAAVEIAEYMSSGYHAPEPIKRDRREKEEKRAAEYGESEPSEKGKLSPDDAPIEDELPDDFEFETDEDGQFAKLIIDENLQLTTEVEGYMKRRRRPAQFGRSIGNISRLYTDPERRIFSHKVKVKGGIVVIDISGSMSLSQADIEAMVEAAPAAVIMAYSHNRLQEGQPNAWVLARRGWRVQEIPHVGGRGNGVDGPALTWAIQQRAPGEPIIWVCDGYVTTARDGQNDALTIQCAQLVKKHRIIMIPDVEEAVKQFKSGKFINRPAGPVREALLGKL